MHRALTLLGVLGALLWISPSWAADGDGCDTDSQGQVTGAGWRTITCVQLCDAKVEADSSCTEFDFNTISRADLIILEREENDANCSDVGGPTFTFTTGPVTGGTPDYDLSGSVVILNDTTDRVVIDSSAAAPNRYLFTAIADDTACTDVDVRMYLVQGRR